MKKLIISLAVLAPSVAMAQTSVVNDSNTLIARIISIGNAIIGLLIAFAVIWIIIAVIRFIMASGDDRADKRSSILWGVVGLAIILSIWGLVALLRNTFNLDNAAPVPDYPVNPNPTPIR